MTAPLPQGLLSVTSTVVNSPASQDPADVLFERHQILHNFWKVHEAKSRTTRDPSDVRCRDLFWRVWGNARLSRNLSASTLTHLFLHCQQPVNVSPFVLNGGRCRGSSAFQKGRGTRNQFQQDESRSSTSPSSPAISSSATSSVNKASVQDYKDEFSMSNQTATSSKTHARTSSQSAISRPPVLTRTSSGSRKRPSFVAGGARTRTRPTLGRKKSSQTSVSTLQVTEPQRSPKSTRHARRSSVEETIDETSPLATNSASRNGPSIPPRSSTISAFELPSASSWQSVDSNIDHRGHPAPFSASQEPTPSLVEKNFREKFAERIQSSSNLASLSRMRKTGSVVRFADEIDLPEEMRKGKEKEQLAIHAEHNQPQHSRHRSSISSVAAVSDDGSDDGVQLPRTKSQLSLMVSEMKRKQSDGSQGSSTSQPQASQQKLRRNDNSTRQAEEQELLEMARRDGVTKAGGVQLPHQQRVRTTGRFKVDESGYESPEGPLY